jgi:hypothetical protein
VRTLPAAAAGAGLPAGAGRLLGVPASAAPTPTLRFEHLSVDDGLAQESVLAIVQDRRRLHVVRHPVRPVALRRLPLHQLPQRGRRPDHAGQQLGARAATSTARAACGSAPTAGWPATIRKAQLSPLLPDEPAKRGNGNRHVCAIVDDGKDGLWLATSDGLQHFDIASGRFATWHHVAGDPTAWRHDNINALALDARPPVDRHLGGLDSLEPDLMRFEHHPSPRGAQVQCGPGAAARRRRSAVDRQHGRAGALAAAGQGKTEKPAAPLRRGRGHAAALRSARCTRTAEHQVWIGSHDRGLYRWLPAPALRAASAPHHRPHSLADNQVSALYRDRVGTFWVGTWYGGVSRADLGSGGFARIVREPDLPITSTTTRCAASTPMARQAVAGQ